MRLKFLGSGDAFGTGGRFNTCFHVDAPSGEFLIDCGASSLIAMRSFGIDPRRIRTIVLSHLHGDHFGGLPFFILDGQFGGRRELPLTLVGPQGLPARLKAAQEALFPRSSERAPAFPLEIVELAERAPVAVGGLIVTAFPADHFSGTPSHHLRIEAEGKVIVYSGDTAFHEPLVEAARGADLFICEAYFKGRQVRGHMDVDALTPRLAEIGARRVVLTHMGAEMLETPAPEGVTKAQDGLEIPL